MLKWGKILTICGVVVLIGAIALGIFGGLKIKSTAENFSQGVAAGSAGEQVSVQMTAGQTLHLWTTKRPWECSGTGDVTFEKYNGSQTFSTDDDTFYKAGTLTAGSEGTTTITCNTDFVANEQDSIGGFIGSVFGIVGAVFGAILAACLLILGVILWVAGRKKATGSGPAAGAQYHM